MVQPTSRRLPCHATLVALATLAVLAGVTAGIAAAATAPTDGTGAAPAHDASVEIVHDGETLTLQPAPNQTVRGESTLDPGTELTVRIETKGEPSFVVNATATVTENGTFAATFDLSRAEPGQGFQVDVFVENEDRPVLGLGGEFADSSNAGESDGDGDAASTTTDDAASSTTADGAETSGQPGFGAGVAAVGVALAAVLVARRR